MKYAQEKDGHMSARFVKKTFLGFCDLGGEKVLRENRKGTEGGDAWAQRESLLIRKKEGQFGMNPEGERGELFIHKRGSWGTCARNVSVSWRKIKTERLLNKRNMLGKVLGISQGKTHSPPWKWN